MWTFCKNLLLGSYHESMCFWLSIPWLKRNSMLKCREDEAKSWPRSSSADGLRGGWQPTLCTCITFKKEKLTPSHLLFLFGANFSLAHCIQELRGSHMGYSSGWPNLQGQTYRSWLERNWANWLGIQLALWDITKWSESRSVMSDSLQPHRVSMDVSRPEHWSGEPIPSPGDLPNPGIEPRSPPLHVDSLPAKLLGKPEI